MEENVIEDYEYGEPKLYVLLGARGGIELISSTPLEGGIECNCHDPHDKIFNNGCSYFYDKTTNCIMWSDELHEIQELNRKKDQEMVDQEWEFQQSLPSRIEAIEQKEERIEKLEKMVEQLSLQNGVALSIQGVDR